MARRKRPKGPAKARGAIRVSPEELARKIRLPGEGSKEGRKRSGAAREGKRPGIATGGFSSRSRQQGSQGAGGKGRGKRVRGTEAKGVPSDRRRRSVLGDFKETAVSHYSDAVNELRAAGARDPKKIRQQALRIAADRTENQGYPRPSADDIGEAPTVRASSTDIAAAEKLRKESNWRTGRGVYGQAGATRHRRTGQPDRYTPPTQFITHEMAKSHQDHLISLLNQPESGFNKDVKDRAAVASRDETGNFKIKGVLTPKQRDRLERYTRSLQRGESHQEAYGQLFKETRGGAARTQRSPRQTVYGISNARVDESLDRGVRMGRKAKYDSVMPKEGERQIGITAGHIDSLSSLGQKFPDATGRDLVAFQTAQRMSVFDQLHRNQRWAQESKIAREVGKGKRPESDASRVVFFTTSLGRPNPSVPSGSLVGQYVIRRRKAMLASEGVASAKQLSGSFPDAVRDMHIIEAGSGVSLGADGNLGAYKKSGFRVGTKKSRGYGKPVPVGSSVIYDSQGRPLYDENGNTRYSEGATRKFQLGTKKELGFRVFIG